jgi:hypothetical protein
LYKNLDTSNKYKINKQFFKHMIFLTFSQQDVDRKEIISGKISQAARASLPLSLGHFAAPTMEDDDECPPLAVELPAQEQSTLAPDSSSSSQVGVTVITGYLGAGKSTVRFPPLPSLP